MPATRLDFDAADAVAAYLAVGATVDVGSFVSVNERSRPGCLLDPARWCEKERDLRMRARWARAANGFMMAVGVPLARSGCVLFG